MALPLCNYVHSEQFWCLREVRGGVGIVGGGEDLGTGVMFGVVQFGLVWGLWAVRRGEGRQPENTNNNITDSQ